jgi:hypothetical protein
MPVFEEQLLRSSSTAALPNPYSHSNWYRICGQVKGNKWRTSGRYYLGVVSEVAAGTVARDPLDAAERNTFRAAVVQSEQELYTAAGTSGDVLTDKLRAVYHRRAVRRVLVEHDYLSITRRSIPQPIQSAKCARITRRAHWIGQRYPRQGVFY